MFNFRMWSKKFGFAMGREDWEGFYDQFYDQIIAIANGWTDR